MEALEHGGHDLAAAARVACEGTEHLCVADAVRILAARLDEHQETLAARTAEQADAQVIGFCHGAIWQLEEVLKWICGPTDA